MFGGPSDASLVLTAASLVGAAAGAAAIFVTISRVGWHKTRLPDRLVQLGTWIVFSSHPRPLAGNAPQPAGHARARRSLNRGAA
jgi:hypothetical protein